MAMDIAYWLFSQTKTTGSFHIVAKLSDSWNSPLVVGAVAEEGDRNRAGLPFLGAERRADRDRQSAADDPVGAEIAPGRLGDVHGTAAAPAIARFAAEEFREHRRQLRALGDAMPVAPVRGSDEIGVAEGNAYADGSRLLPDRQMHRAVAKAANVGLFRRLFEAADPMHPAQRVHNMVGRKPVVNFRTI